MKAPRTTAALLELLPTGEAWSRDTASDLVAVIDAFAVELERVQGRIEDLLRETDPRGALELLSAWESALGLPSECTGPLETIDERRGAILARLSVLGGATPAFFQELAARLGYVVRVEEFRPFEVGRSRVGQALTNSGRPFEVGRSRVGEALTNGRGWVYSFAIYAPLVTVRTFRVGASVAGERLATWQNVLLECVIGSVLPAHVAAVFRYEIQQPQADAIEARARLIDPALLEFLASELQGLDMLPNTFATVALVNECALLDEWLLASGSTAAVELPTVFLARDLFAQGGIVQIDIAGGYTNATGVPVSAVLEFYRDAGVTPWYSFALEDLPPSPVPLGVGQFWARVTLAFRGTDYVLIRSECVANPNTTAAGTIASGHGPVYQVRDVSKNWGPVDMRDDRRIVPKLRKTGASAATLNVTACAAVGLVVRSNGGAG